MTAKSSQGSICHRWGINPKRKEVYPQNLKLVRVSVGPDPEKREGKGRVVERFGNGAPRVLRRTKANVPVG